MRFFRAQEVSPAGPLSRCSSGSSSAPSSVCDASANVEMSWCSCRCSGRLQQVRAPLSAMRVSLLGMLLTVLLAAGLLLWASRFYDGHYALRGLLQCETASMVMAGCSMLASVYTAWCCARLPQRRLLAKQVLSLALANFLACTVILVAPMESNACVNTASIFFYFVVVSIVVQDHIAVSALLMAARRHRCLPCWEKMLWWIWPSVLALYLPLWPWARYDEKMNLCVEDRLHKVVEFSVAWGSALLLLVTYVLTVIALRRHSPPSVVAAQIRSASGYILSSFITYAPYNAYLVHNYYNDAAVEENLTYFCVGEVFLCAQGVLVAAVYATHRMHDAGRCHCRSRRRAPPQGSPLPSRRNGLARAHSAHFAVAYAEAAEVVLLEAQSSHRHSCTDSADATGPKSTSGAGRTPPGSLESSLSSIGCK